jgi:hypothetical protein
MVWSPCTGSPWRTMSTRTMATGLARAGEHVWEGASDVLSAWEKGEGERRSAAMGRVHALACPGTWPCTLWHAWMSLGTSWPGRCTRLLGRGLASAGAGE